MRKPFYSIVNKKDDSTAEMLIYGVIGPDMWGDGVQAKQFVTDLQNLAKANTRINIRINSPGGSVFDGMAIVNAISACSADVHTYNDGICFSMAAVILLAGNTVHVAKTSMTMLHNVSGGSYGNSQDMRTCADMMDKYDQLLGSFICDKTGKPEDEVKSEFLNYKDNYFCGDEMMEEGLANVMEEYETKDTPPDPKNMSLHAIAAFYNERMEAPSPSFMSQVINQVKNIILPNPNPNNPEMNFPKLTAHLTALAGGTAATQEELDAVNVELTEAGITNVGLFLDTAISDGAAATAQLAIQNAEVTRLTGELTNTRNEVTTLKAEKTVLEQKVARGPAAAAPVVAPTDPGAKTQDQITNEAINAMPFQAELLNNPLFN